MSDPRDPEERHGPDTDTDAAVTSGRPDAASASGSGSASASPSDSGTDESVTGDGGTRSPSESGADSGADSRSGSDSSSSSSSDSRSDSESGSGLEEDALRRLMRDSVRDIEPSPGALEHLHHAVPARRTRRRQMALGLAAAVVVGGAAIPALLHTDLVPGVGDKPMHAASHAESRGPGEQGTAGDVNADVGTEGRTDGSTTGGDSDVADDAPSSGRTSGPDPSSTLGAVSPTCTPAQLGQQNPESGAADAEGRVYGSFRVVNVSADPCTVDGDGIVAAAAEGDARSHMIQVVDHTTGDAATGLPDPATAADEIVLQPGAAYLVRFAWIPREGGGTSGCAASPPPGDDSGTSEGGTAPTASPGSADSGGGGSDAGTSGAASGGSGDSGGTSGGDSGGGGQPAASVLVSHRPDVGDTAAAIRLDGACAGTVYRTGVLPAS